MGLHPGNKYYAYGLWFGRSCSVHDDALTPKSTHKQGELLEGKKALFWYFLKILVFGFATITLFISLAFGMSYYEQPKQKKIFFENV